jgi:hypothetical protein
MTTTLDTIKDTIQKDIEGELKNLAYFNQLVKVFKPFEGKKITKRMETAVKIVLPDRVVHLSKAHGMFNMEIWGADIARDDRLSFFMGYDSDPIYREGDAEKRLSGFRYFSCCYGSAAIERNEKRRDFLEDSAKLKELARLFDNYKEAVSGLDNYSEYETPSWYAIQKVLKVTL